MYKSKNMEFIKDKDLNWTCKGLLYFLLSAGENGYWIGRHKYLSNTLGIQYQSVGKYINQLIKKGYLEKCDLNGQPGYRITPSLAE